MKISILLPFPSKRPIGGFKIVYSYLSKIIDKNNDFQCTFYYTINAVEKNVIKRYLKYFYYKYLHKSFYTWSDISYKAKHKLDIDHDAIQASDVIIVTSVITAIYLRKHHLDKNKKVLYFIQHFEDWAVSKEKVIETYHYGYHNIVVSMWLKGVLHKYSAPVSLHIPNPIDNIFTVINTIENRNLKSILFLYHKIQWKGSREAIEALNELKRNYPDIKVSCFSAQSKPSNFPNWIHFYKQPTRSELLELYNNHAIFLSTSYMEGFGLTPAEAMGCGCCVLTTASGGVDDFAIHNQTAYVVKSPPNPKEIATALTNLIDNKDLMYALAKQGNKKIKKFNWDTNTNKIIKLLKGTK